jgi:hypothetical protein
MYILQDARATIVHLSYYWCAYSIVLPTWVRIHVTVMLVITGRLWGIVKDVGKFLLLEPS